MEDQFNQTVKAQKVFIVKTELPVNLIMVRSAVASATQVSEILSYSSIDKFNLEVAVEEAFCNAVKHFSRIANNDERIFLEYYIEGDSLVVSIRENGIPFDLKQADVYMPGSLDGMNSPGLGMLLMHKGMDSVELFVHGRDGKETRLTKKIKYGTIPEELFSAVVKKQSHRRPLVKNAIIRLATKNDLQEICRLAWRCYGYTQEELLYDLDLLTNKFLSGEFKPLVSFDPASGNMIAHVGLKYHDCESKVPELGLAFIDPAFKCPGMTAEMAKASLKISKDNGDMGVFDCSVTTHTFSQKAMQEYFGSRPCGLFMGITAAGMQVKELPTTKQEKGSVVNHYFAFDRSGKTIYVSPHHQQMITEIYGWLELPREFGNPNMEVPVGKSSVTVFSLPDELNVAFIIVHKIGEETVNDVINGMNQCRQERKDAVYAFLPLGVDSSPYLVEQCEKLGLSFAGIMPHIHDGDDRILMQCISIPLDTDKIRVYGEKSTKLLSYIIKEQNRINGF